jgi:hypothetical protein
MPELDELLIRYGEFENSGHQQQLFMAQLELRYGRLFVG